MAASALSGTRVRCDSLFSERPCASRASRSCAPISMVVLAAQSSIAPTGQPDSRVYETVESALVQGRAGWLQFHRQDAFKTVSAGPAEAEDARLVKGLRAILGHAVREIRAIRGYTGGLTNDRRTDARCKDAGRTKCFQITDSDGCGCRLCGGRVIAGTRASGASGDAGPRGPRRLLQAAERSEGRALARHDDADGRRRRLLQHRVPQRAEGPHRLRAPLRAHDVPGLAEPRQDGVHPARRVERRPAERLDALRLHELLPGRPVARARDGALGRSRPHARPRDRRRRTSRTSRRSSRTRSRSTS